MEKLIQYQELFKTLQIRFETYPQRHEGITWTEIQARLAQDETKLDSLIQMEMTGGEPDVVGRDEQTGEFLFFDCSPETPKGRRSLCFDKAAWESRKEHKPAGNAVEMAKSMGIRLLTETEYRRLQELGVFDAKTSSWIETPEPVRKLGGALFCDRRFNRVFVYHNGAESYYAVRGFRGCLKV